MKLELNKRQLPAKSKEDAEKFKNSGMIFKKVSM